MADSATGAVRWGTTQAANFTSTSTAISTAITTGTRLVRVVASTGCHLAIGGSPTATTSSPKLPANWIETLVVYPGEKIAAIRTTTSGTLWVTEVS